MNFDYRPYITLNVAMTADDMAAPAFIWVPITIFMITALPFLFVVHEFLSNRTEE